ncbi:hypothetical protein HYH02_002189 [Chlamydomonas schloesseri]|uniref:Elongator complex protein 6 n=1 Tax=Chlamydomonas schloesseri TaxID=2026947 RepID=A0A836BAY6_9CHLO|nr:hypothetical protein HYH02_002189 [Chlamydomonas schloesseri]|eukprot:KAG2452843.1 hypothetical protein HYH02_002189 [Chlamydomonas schloesseri]
MSSLPEDEFGLLAGCSVRSGGLTLVKGSLELSGLFLVQQYLKLLLQGHNYAVVLVTTEQVLERHQYAAKKMGVSLAQYQQSGHLFRVEAPLAAVGGGNAGLAPSSGGGISRLQQLIAAVQQAAKQRAPSAAGVALVIDSLTVLSGMCPAREEWTAFLHYCCSGALGAGAGCRDVADHAQPNRQQVPYCFVAGVYGDVPDDRPWLASLEHRANAVVSVGPLPGGKMADVDGQVTFTQRFGTPQPVSGPGLGGPPALADTVALAGSVSAVAPPQLQLRQSLYFRSTELAVKWMAAVTSQELL